MLTSKSVKRIELEHEPGEWVEVRMPSIGIIQRAQRVANEAPGDVDARASYAVLPMLEACILTWSYPEPVTADNIADLDAQTVTVLTTALMSDLTEDGRKNSSGPSTKP